MQWWLTVFFLIGNGWVLGDHADGWASRAQASEARCEMRQPFAAQQTERFPLAAPARWLCSRDQPATRLPLATRDVTCGGGSPPREAHWSNADIPLGLQVFTPDQLPWMAEDGLGLRYTGPLRPAFASELRKLLLESPRRINHVVLELDSDGGELGCVNEIVSVLREARGRMELTTRVMEGSLCASGCIPVFMQGERRKASGSSIWVFHGARSAFTNVPDPIATAEYLDLLSASGLKPGFRAMLEADNRIYRPGSFILSGHELLAVHDSGIITELFPAWREETPVFSSGLGPR